MPLQRKFREQNFQSKSHLARKEKTFSEKMEQHGEVWVVEVGQLRGQIRGWRRRSRRGSCGSTGRWRSWRSSI
jgi:hypothetical protein